jgi:hypothetical protein
MSEVEHSMARSGIIAGDINLASNLSIWNLCSQAKMRMAIHALDMRTHIFYRLMKMAMAELIA